MSNIAAAAKPVALSPSQLAMLKSCLERDDRTFPVTDWHQGVRGRAVVKKLVELGLIRPVEAGDGVASDEPTISAYALTEAGAHELGVPPLSDADKLAAKTFAEDSPGAGVVATPASGTAVHAPREGTKLHEVVLLLSGSESVPIEAIMAKTGWLAHTSRAALSGLRKRGYRILTSRSADNRALYRVISEQG